MVFVGINEEVLTSFASQLNVINTEELYVHFVTSRGSECHPGSSMSFSFHCEVVGRHIRDFKSLARSKFKSRKIHLDTVDSNRCILSNRTYNLIRSKCGTKGSFEKYRSDFEFIFCRVVFATYSSILNLKKIYYHDLIGSNFSNAYYFFPLNVVSMSRQCTIIFKRT